MKFFGVRDKANEPAAIIRAAVLREACASRGIEYVDLAADTVSMLDLVQPDADDVVYKLTRGAHALETWFLARGVTSFWNHEISCELNLMDTSTVWSIVHDAHGLPAPKTVHHLTTRRDHLIAAASDVGGYPLILKVAGGSLGQGVIKVDSQQGLFSAADYVAATGKPFIVREFIADAKDVRAVVVRGQVVKIYGYETQAGDFRSNPMGHVVRCPENLNADACLDAVRAVHLIGVTAGAVDFRVADSGRHYLLEVNLPFGLSAEDSDVAIAMVDHLVIKSNDHKRI